MKHLKVFMGATIAAFAFFFGVLQAHDYFGLTFLTNTTLPYLKASLLVTSSVAAGSVTTMLSVFGALPFQSRPEPSEAFEDSLLGTLREALRGKNYVEVIRIGEALSRPLFESGSFSTRLKIGRVVEEAAARSERVDKQISALIDSVGWSLVELGRYDEAKRPIIHGMELSQDTGNAFYEAKGLRHLGVIERRTKNYPEAEKYYKKSLEIAEKITDENDKEVMIAGLNYALASLYFYTSALEKADKYIELSISCFKRLNDEYRLNMCLVMKGDIQFKRGESDKARDTYRKVLRLADRNTEKLQVSRSLLGLAEIYISDNRWAEANETAVMLEDVDLKEFRAEGERLEAIRRKLPDYSARE
ncbi:tetratricopeptide repeat protein [Rhizobium sp. L1K21]|uniref:tetratricopeptide repeat protein n=1 Tax=Rhizobium sp. L1K21 TaxID=2954933 RepID=UPI002092127B|nr:tetratricopeptide repeat protein [Rhizobium sp. L1K21]MCO6185202.1 tetratricopeptide repeat protein [Rhizobium sp. L1K21]